MNIYQNNLLRKLSENMELGTTIKTLDIVHSEIIEALEATSQVPKDTSTSSREIIPPDTVMQPLQKRLEQLGFNMLNFIRNVFPPTGKALTKKKKELFILFSPALAFLEQEFRLPNTSGLEPKVTETENKSWDKLKSSHEQLVGTLRTVIYEMENGSSHEASKKWSEEDYQRGSKLVKLSTIRLLLSNILVQWLYSLVLSKAEVEFEHRSYNQAFEGLKEFKISQRLRTAWRQARNSQSTSDKAWELLVEENIRYQEVKARWEREIEKRETRRAVISKNTFEMEQRLADKSKFERMLPAVTEAAINSIVEMLDFLPNPEESEAALPNHDHEGRKIADCISEDIASIGKDLEINSSESTTEDMNYLKSNPKLAQVKPQHLCWNYQVNGKCRFKTQCRYYHEKRQCKFYKEGRCRFSSKCWFSHSDKISTRSVSGIREDSRKGDQQRENRRNKKKRNGSPTRPPTSPREEVECIDWEKEIILLKNKINELAGFMKKSYTSRGPKNHSEIPEELTIDTPGAVSYTHLTLPTKRIV